MKFGALSLDIAKQLIAAPSITPNDAGAINIVKNQLEKLGFKSKIYEFGDGDAQSGKDAKITNLYAKYGEGAPNLCFAGHTDVVPIGDANAWLTNPFEPVIKDGVLYGRGIADMKGAIACWIEACAHFIHENPQFQGALSMLITGDEESHAVHGTKLLLPAITNDGEILNACLTGEPTCPKTLGDMIKIGRRGSLNITLKCFGIQGHTGYPHLADNATHRMVQMLQILNNWVIDQGNEFFEPSTLSVSTIDTGNSASNIIPANCTAKINIRFNNLHDSQSLKQKISELWQSIPHDKYHAEFSVSGESFLTPRGKLSETLSQAIKQITNITPELSTTGGTSDSRFIKDYCEVCDFGLRNHSIHQINEHAAVHEIAQLSEIYYQFIKNYFGVSS